MVSIKDYAASHGVSYEAVRRQIARYSGREMDGFRISDHGHNTWTMRRQHSLMLGGHKTLLLYNRSSETKQ